MKTVYGNNQDILVKMGQSVRRGQTIATMGSSDASRVQLTFRVRVGDGDVDPVAYLRAAATAEQGRAQARANLPPSLCAAEIMANHPYPGSRGYDVTRFNEGLLEFGIDALKSERSDLLNQLQRKEYLRHGTMWQEIVRQEWQCKADAIQMALDARTGASGNGGNLAGADESDRAIRSAQAMERAHKSRFFTFSERSSRQEKEPGSGKRRLVLPKYSQCLTAVDLRQDSTVTTLYWYAIRNNCSQALQALWCEGASCKPVDKAAEIPPGGKEQSWLDIRWLGGSARNMRDIRFHGTACQIPKYRPNDVMYDKDRGECWVWEQ